MLTFFPEGCCKSFSKLGPFSRPQYPMVSPIFTSFLVNFTKIYCDIGLKYCTQMSQHRKMAPTLGGTHQSDEVSSFAKCDGLRMHAHSCAQPILLPKRLPCRPRLPLRDARFFAAMGRDVIARACAWDVRGGACARVHAPSPRR